MRTNSKRAFFAGGALLARRSPKRAAVVVGMAALLAAAGVPYGKWIRFLAPIYAGLFLLGLVAVGIAILIRLS